MRAAEKILESVGERLDFMHQTRQRALFDAVVALLDEGKLPLSELGRAIAKGSTDDKHGIKRIDRLLGNRHLHAELPAIYGALVHWLCRSGQRPILLLDWTEAGDTMCALAATLCFDGRPLPLYREVHPEAKLGNRDVQAAFLERLRQMLPTGCRPIVVADAGFHVPFLQAVTDLGWDYVVRIRGGLCVGLEWDPTFIRSAQLFRWATRSAQDLGRWHITESHQWLARVVLFDGRSRRARRPSRAGKRGIAQQRAAQAAREPWILITSLEELPAIDVVAIYKRRTQIEQHFRDTKSHRFGWSFEDVRTDSTERLAVLLLIAALATLCALLAGFVAERCKMHKGYQANTVRDRRVLSLVNLGCRILRRCRDWDLLSVSQLRQFHAYLLRLAFLDGG